MTVMELQVEDFAHAPEFEHRIEQLAGKKGLANSISIPYVHRPGLALSGFTEFLMKNQFQVFGQTEIYYLRQLDSVRRDKALRVYFDFGVACLIIARNLKVPEELLAHAERTSTPVFRCNLPTHILTESLAQFLDERFARTTNLHGVLMDVYGVGILLLGRGGIGKSECALELLLRGHRLVSDDMVLLKRISPDIIRGEPTDIVKFHMEVRGLGIINVKELFGISSIRTLKKVHLIVKLVDWDEQDNYDRVGLEENYFDVLGIQLPLINLPVAPGRNISAIIEVAAKNHLLKLEGFHAAQEFQKNLIERLEGNQSNPDVDDDE